MTTTRGGELGGLDLVLACGLKEARLNFSRAAPFATAAAAPRIREQHWMDEGSGLGIRSQLRLNCSFFSLAYGRNNDERLVLTSQDVQTINIMLED